MAVAIQSLHNGIAPHVIIDIENAIPMHQMTHNALHTVLTSLLTLNRLLAFLSLAPWTEQSALEVCMQSLVMIGKPPLAQFELLAPWTDQTSLRVCSPEA